MSWRLAKALGTFRSEVNAKWPNRSKASDGTIGDEAHASRSSDHNPWIKDPPGPNVVAGMDITHDPANGVDTYALAEFLRTKKDPRVEYVISNGQIFSSHVEPWRWRKYNGANKHNHHVHISVKYDKAHYDNTMPWGILDGPIIPSGPEITHPTPTPDRLRRGNSGAEVRILQVKLSAHNVYTPVDGEFGPATEEAVIKFQKAHGLHADGIVGPQTWTELLRT